ncbi:MAG: hypothetical protein KIT52_19735 [Anaerolineae bacterium]|nr:hypothetical protein [Anaerolineae bacterium]
MAQTNTYDPTATDRDERRWDRWGRLTLVIGVVLLVWPVLTTLATYRYPTDGWSSTPIESFSIGGPQRLTEPLTTQATPLQADDVVVALDGRPLLANTPPPLPPGLAEGQVIRYTLERAGQTVKVDVTLIRLGPSALLLDQLQLFRSNPGNSLFVFAMLSIATTVFVLRPGSLAARYLFLFAAFDFGIGLRTSSDLYAFTYPSWLSFLSGIYGFGWVYIFLPCITLLALVFPVRKWPARRFPRLLPLAVSGLPLAASVVANALIWFGGHLSAYRVLSPLTFYAACWALIVVPVALLHNLLTIHEPLARAQMRWLAFGLGLGFIVPLITLLVSVELWPVSDPRREAILVVGNLALLIFPICLAIGILRYRLFDIDVIIRRTTSYAIITGLLALVYFGSIVVLQQLLSPFTGDSTPAVVLSTLFIAALFLPVRRRVQDWIDRRFNRTRYDAEKTLAAFAATARDETDLDALLAELVRVIQETMQPEHVSVWLRPADSSRPPGEDAI